MRRRSTVALLAALMVMAMTLGASAAFAGEVKGPPGPDGAEGGVTPIDSETANSICSFSGLNDEITTEGEFPEPTQTQSYGTFLVLIKKDVGIQAAKAILPSPGVACNPNGGFEE
jgi:hypothetical protein